MLMPGGFGFSEPRFWVNRVLPVVVATGCVLAIVSGRRKKFDAVAVSLWALFGIYLSAAGSSLILFPVTGRYPMLVGLVACAVVLLAAIDVSRMLAQRRLLTIFSAIIGGLIGVGFIFIQRPFPPSTLPIGRFPTTQPATFSATSLALIKLSDELRVHPSDGSIDITRGRIFINLYPLLTFTSRSPDGFWTCFSSKADRIESPRALLGFNKSADELNLYYKDDSAESLDCKIASDHSILLDAQSTLSKIIYSHLNTFTSIHIAGHRKLAISFSPCADVKIDLTPQDSAPARFAYLDQSEIFHVVQATKNEKGPFTNIAAGKLARGSPMTITLFDSGRSIAEITLADWSAQLSTGLSPTAGWNVPQNSIEFSLNGDSDKSAGSIYISLAATSVGRGFDSVAHAPGTYVNRIAVKMSE